jgi:hypothetical protein
MGFADGFADRVVLLMAVLAIGMLRKGATAEGTAHQEVRGRSGA